MEVNIPTHKDLADWYDARYRLGPDVMRPYEAYPWQLRFLNPRRGAKLLDVCCGSGYFLKAAYDYYGMRTWGADISPEAVACCGTVTPTSCVVVSPAETLPFKDGMFGYVTCLGSLEHVQDIDAALEEMKRVACPGAQFFITVPNRNFIYWRFGGKRATEQSAINENPKSLDEWRAIFARHKLTIERLGQDRWYVNKVKNRLGRIFVRAAAAVLPLRWCYVFVFVLRRMTVEEEH